MRADDDRVLPEQRLQSFAILPPPSCVDVLGHHLEDDDLVAVGASFVRPKSLCRGTGEGGQSAEPFRQFASDIGIKLLAERLARVVVQRKKNLNELHAVRAS